MNVTITGVLACGGSWTGCNCWNIV